ncbi:MAG: thiamine phosphate synthase [Acidobacteriota bacterium]
MRVYAITQRSLAPGRDLASTIRRWAECGVDRVQIREKDLAARQVYDLARRVLERPVPEGFELFINERFDIALAAGAHGVHLGARSLPVRLVRRRVGGRLRIGYSAHTVDEAIRAARDGADLVTLSPIFATHSKPMNRPELGTGPLCRAVRGLGETPLFALGGINPERAVRLRGTGIAGVALTGCLMRSTDPAGTVSALRRALEGD